MWNDWFVVSSHSKIWLGSYKPGNTVLPLATHTKQTLQISVCTICYCYGNILVPLFDIFYTIYLICEIWACLKLSPLALALAYQRFTALWHCKRHKQAHGNKPSYPKFSRVNTNTRRADTGSLEKPLRVAECKSRIYEVKQLPKSCQPQQCGEKNLPLTIAI